MGFDMLAGTLTEDGTDCLSIIKKLLKGYITDKDDDINYIPTFTLFTDNWYTTCDVATYIQQIGGHFIGTVRLNRAPCIEADKPKGFENTAMLQNQIREYITKNNHKVV